MVVNKTLSASSSFALFHVDTPGGERRPVVVILFTSKRIQVTWGCCPDFKACFPDLLFEGHLHLHECMPMQCAFMSVRTSADW